MSFLLPLRPLRPLGSLLPITMPTPALLRPRLAPQRLTPQTQTPPTQARPFHTTPPQQSYPRRHRYSKLNPNKVKGADQKIYIFRRYRSKRLPAPLRMGRNRHLRHWTIHRAWQLYQHKEHDRRKDELYRMQQGMSAALEELRKTAGPGTRKEGYLYEHAIKKYGIWGKISVPIEYARIQVETPPRVAWDHEWKASTE